MPDIFPHIKHPERDIPLSCLPENYCPGLDPFRCKRIEDCHSAGIIAAPYSRITLFSPVSLVIGKYHFIPAKHVKKRFDPFGTATVSGLG